MEEKREQNNNEIKFRRQDWELFLELHSDVKEIKKMLTENNIPKMKTDVSWLKNIIIWGGSILSGVILIIAGILFKR